MDQQMGLDRVRGLIIDAARAVRHIAYHRYAGHVRCEPFDLIAQHNVVHQYTLWHLERLVRDTFLRDSEVQYLKNLKVVILRQTVRFDYAVQFRVVNKKKIIIKFLC